MDKDNFKLVIALIATVAMYGCILFVISRIPVGTPGLLNRQEETTENYSICPAEQSMIKGIPGWIFDDPEIVMDAVIATPSQAIEEPLKAKKEEPTTQEPEMTYFGVMATTGYVATGNPCADGVYPQVGWTVACNDSRLWHKTIYIEGIGTRYVHDTGGMASSVLDVFVGSVSEAYNITSRGREVYIVEE